MEQKMHNFFAIYLSFLTVSSVVKIHVILFERIHFKQGKKIFKITCIYILAYNKVIHWLRYGKCDENHNGIHDS